MDSPVENSNMLFKIRKAAKSCDCWRNVGGPEVSFRDASDTKCLYLDSDEHVWYL